MSPGSLRANPLLRAATACLVGVLLVAGAAWRGFETWMDAPLQLRTSTLVELPEGGNLTHFLGELHSRGFVAHPVLLRLHARLNGIANRVRAGEYRLEPGLTPRQLLAILLAGDVVQYAVTIIEGTTLQQVFARLREQPQLRIVLDDVPATELLGQLGLEHASGSAEGLFFPDTYHFHRGMRDADILLAAYRRMQEILGEEWEQRDSGLPYADRYEALVMASLIERETGVAAEREQIAGVFVRRLRAGMLLQTDPSVIYGLGEAFAGNLTRAHLQMPGPYNTYLNPGLPPTPIALPGRASIHAALHPAAGGALYFVARGDGSHEFSDTLEQHNRAVQRFQRGRRSGSDYRSAPPR